jgi:hypothetical protein
LNDDCRIENPAGRIAPPDRSKKLDPATILPQRLCGQDNRSPQSSQPPVDRIDDPVGERREKTHTIKKKI